MSYWDRLDRYRNEGPEAAGEFVLRSAKEFDPVVGRLSDEILGPLGWSRKKGLWWSKRLSQWAEKVIEFQPMKGGLGVRWGLSLSFVPRVGRSKPPALHLSYNPRDYQRDASPWALSRFSTDAELRVDLPDLVRRADTGAESLDACCRDLTTLSRCFEVKKEMKYVRFGFRQYPSEVISYAAVLGLMGRREQALQELEEPFERLALSPVDRQRWLRELNQLWEEGVEI